MLWEQDTYGAAGYGAGSAYGCDSCAPLMTGWSAGGTTAHGEFYDMADQGLTGCSCGEQHSSNGPMYTPEGNGPYEYSTDGPMMNLPPHDQSRTFPPSHPPAAPPVPAPMPPSLNPMDPTKGYHENPPREFDPLPNENAPAADSAVDPVSFEIPRLPPLPERAHSSVKRGGNQPVQLISTDAEQFRR